MIQGDQLCAYRCAITPRKTLEIAVRMDKMLESFSETDMLFSIPGEIKQHPWMLQKLPFYLSLPPGQMEEEEQALDPQIIDEVRKAGIKCELSITNFLAFGFHSFLS
jgi:hypothetical protein